VRFLLDTDISIYLLKKTSPKAIREFEKLAPGDVAISTITVSELYYGAEKSKQVQRNLDAIENFISPLVILNFDKTAAVHYGRVRKHLELTGKIIGQMDMQIASVGLASNLIVVTNNVREFKRVPGLRVENWI